MLPTISKTVRAASAITTHPDVRVSLITVGKPRDRMLGKATRAYLDRLGHYARVDEHVIREGRDPDPARVRRIESEAILAATPDRAKLVLLDEGGDVSTSRALADWIDRSMTYGTSHIAFAIGGAHGHDDIARAASDRILSLSAFTMPHELARLVLAEQLYRAFTILRGEPYHKD
jgi:23S rRNA (pseudouridine1915-N3)-methyltransferase